MLKRILAADPNSFSALAIYHDGTIAAENLYHEAIERILFIGRRINWNTGAGHVQEGTVLKHSRGDRIFVRNDNTGAEYWLGVSWVTHAH